MNTLDRVIVDQMKMEGGLKKQFIFEGIITVQGTEEWAELKKLADASGVKVWSSDTSNKLFKACDNSMKYGDLSVEHPIYEFFEKEVWDNNGECKNHSLLLCAIDKNDLVDACPWNEGMQGSIGDLCECTN